LPFARSIASMLIFVVIGVPSAKFQSNYYGIKDAVRWGHPPHQFSSPPRGSILDADRGSGLNAD
ncbi:hypothetical protein, partial [Roseovarius sp. TE539]|uniref:hypothetical protein n=1 Tax=Roseovarius sp. TE539 TaxID=2249812 RepID=UPI001C665617